MFENDISFSRRKKFNRDLFFDFEKKNYVNMIF